MGVTAYSMDQILLEPSPDGWVTSIDGASRKKALSGKGKKDAEYVQAGGLTQRQGRSAIDNTVLSNLFMPEEAAMVLNGRRFRKVLCQLVALRQKCLIRRISAELCMDLLADGIPFQGE